MFLSLFQMIQQYTKKRDNFGVSPDLNFGLRRGKEGTDY